MEYKSEFSIESHDYLTEKLNLLLANPSTLAASMSALPSSSEALVTSFLRSKS